MKEKVIEKRLREGVEALGGLCYKFVSPGRRGVPDRLIVFPFCPPYMVETKAPDKDAEDHQKREHARLRKRQMAVFVVDTNEKVDAHLYDRYIAKRLWLVDR